MYQHTRRSPQAQEPLEEHACLACRYADPHARHQHYLVLAQEMDTPSVEAHLYEDLLARYKGDVARAARCTRDTLGWIQGQIEPFQEKVDEHTGAKLGWWEARQRYLREMRQAYAAIEERGRQVVQAKAAAAHVLLPRVPPVYSEPAAPLEEPTADESAEWEAAMARAWQDEDASDYITVPDEE